MTDWARRKLCWVCVALTLFVSANVVGAPTTNTSDIIPFSAAGGECFLPSDDVKITPAITTDWQICDVASDESNPFSVCAELRGVATGQIKTLPAIPGTVLMVLCGFLCVSLVRDNRTWLRVAGGLLWVGYAVIGVVPQLGHRLFPDKNTRCEIAAKLSHVFHFEESDDLSGDLRSTRYMGLLHRLADLPDCVEWHLLPSMKVISAGVFCGPKAEDVRPGIFKNTITLQAVRLRSWSLCLLPKCPACRVGLFGYLSAGFIFGNLSANPPPSIEGIYCFI